MAYYYIKEKLEEVPANEALNHEYPYVAIVTAEEFNRNSAFLILVLIWILNYQLLRLPGYL